MEGMESRPRKGMNVYQVKATEEGGEINQTKGKTKEMNLVSNPKVELRGHVKAKILLAVHRKR